MMTMQPSTVNFQFHFELPIVCNVQTSQSCFMPGEQGRAAGQRAPRSPLPLPPCPCPQDLQENTTKTEWLPLEFYTTDGACVADPPQAQLQVSLSPENFGLPYNPHQRPQLVVTVLEAADLTDLEQRDCVGLYCMVTYGKAQQRTVMQAGAALPSWQQSFTFFPASPELLTEHPLVVEVCVPPWLSLPLACMPLCTVPCSCALRVYGIVPKNGMCYAPFCSRQGGFCLNSRGLVV